MRQEQVMSRKSPSALPWIIGGGFVLAAIAVVAAATSRKQHRLTPFIRALYDRVARHFAFRAPPLVEDYNVDNAQSDGQTIRVNPAWLDAILKAGCTDERCTWSFVTGVLAHELGHHSRRVRGMPFGGHAEELEADEVAGQVLALEGIGADDFGRILGSLSAHGSATHPDGFTRRNAITRGYYGAA
jgi:hypothetical protein